MTVTKKQTGHSAWAYLRGIWTTNLLIVVFLKCLFSIIPGVSKEASWTMTNVCYNLGTFIFLHWIIGTPISFETDDGKYFGATLWEQIDDGYQYTPARKFLTLFPIALFLLSVHYTHYDAYMFSINLVTLVINLIGKLPIMHYRRLLGINQWESDIGTKTTTD